MLNPLDGIFHILIPIIIKQKESVRLVSVYTANRQFTFYLSLFIDIKKILNAALCLLQ